MIRVTDIQAAVASHYRLAPGVMKSPSRKRNDARPRQLAMCLAERLTDHSLVRIGHFFGGRHHATVIHALRAVEQRAARDPDVHSAMRRLTKLLLIEARVGL